jgi:vitamin K-dependent gamma-carboxylase
VILYVYAGLAKLNSDWFRGEPLRGWLQELSATPVVGEIFERPETFFLLAWGGLGFDLFIVPLLLWKRTRAAAFVVAVCFHLMNAWFFTIGIFPWLSLAMTTLFLEPDWPRRLLRRLGRRAPPVAEPPPAWAPAVTTADGIERRALILTLLSLYLAFQMLFPLRHWLYPGDVAWTEEGHEFSWRMKLRGKVGETVFVVMNPATRELWFDRAENYLASWQVRKMETRPDLIRQFARHLAMVTTKELETPVKVRAQTIVRLNGHPPAQLIDPEFDLSEEPYRIAASKWITPRP